jgi:CspA family cold shock protein
LPASFTTANNADGRGEQSRELRQTELRLSHVHFLRDWQLLAIKAAPYKHVRPYKRWCSATTPPRSASGERILPGPGDSDQGRLGVMAAGTIKKLVSDKGFGFIQTGDGSDIFFHHSTVQDAQFENLREGQQVEYTVEQGGRRDGKGPRAATVVPA